MFIPPAVIAAAATEGLLAHLLHERNDNEAHVFSPYRFAIFFVAGCALRGVAHFFGPAAAIAGGLTALGWSMHYWRQLQTLDYLPHTILAGIALGVSLRFLVLPRALPISIAIALA